MFKTIGLILKSGANCSNTGISGAPPGLRLGATVVVREYTGIIGPLCFRFVVFFISPGGLEVTRFPGPGMLNVV